MAVVTTVDDPLPSELFSKYNNGESSPQKGEVEVDYEAMLQNGLSALAAQQDLIDFWLRDEKEEIPNWLWQTLTTSENDLAESKPSQDSPEYEWWMGVRFLHSLIPKVTPFELHSVVNQSIVFTDGSQAYCTLCLLLCVYALRECPSPIQERWKRWQSLVCETIRLFQSYGVEIEDLAVPLWIHHLVPACQQVIQKLPSEAYRVAFLSSLVGTTSTLVVLGCKTPEKGTTKGPKLKDTLLPHVIKLLDEVRSIVEQGFDHTETWVCLHPWRVYSSKLAVEEQCEDVEFLRHEHDITWWNQSAHRHERVAGMDTSWDDLGISLLALLAFENRPAVLTPAYTWRVWFPHVCILFKTTGDYPFLKHFPLALLDDLLQVVPEKSLPAVSSTSEKPDSPFETFQLLSNRIMAKPSDAKSKKKELKSDSRSGLIVGLMKSLLTRYQPENQVKIVRKLVHDCPHPGLQAKLIDLLRPVIFEEEAADALWTYIHSFVKDLLAYVDKENDTLVETNDLVQKMEVYVGAITMIQVWCMRKGKLPKKIKGTALGNFYKILKKMLAYWISDSLAMPPNDYYRLYLLEGALEQLMRILGAARKDETSVSSSGSICSSEAGESFALSQDRELEEAKPSVIVGEVDIFS
jgi:hypothetical protein